MTELDRLPPDQRAVLSLVLDRGKSYAEVSRMLSIPEATVRDRAHAALDALARTGANAAGGAATARTAAVGAGGAATARTAAVAAAGTATGPVAPDDEPGPREPIRPAAGAPPPTTPSPTSASSTDGPSGARPPLPAGSRRAGALLLAGIVVVAVVAVVLLTSGGKGSSGTTANQASTHTSQSTSTTPNTSARIDKKLTLSPAEPESGAHGEGYVLSDGNRRAFYVAAKGLAPSRGFFYAVWLYNSPSSAAPLGRAPSVGSNGQLEGGGPLPSNASNYAKLIITRETNTHARSPGSIVLSGPFSLH